MLHIEGDFKGVKSVKIYYQAWLPDDAPKAVVQVIHGFAEHSGRYLNVVNELVPLGYAIYANDHRGHGKSEGLMNYADSIDDFVEDEKKMYDVIKDKHADLPIFVLGHSMGSGIAMYFAKKYETLLKGLVLSGTGTKFGGDVPGFLKTMAKLLSKIAPKMKNSSGLDANLLSHDKEAVKAYMEDPLVHYKKITVKLATIMFESFQNTITFVGNLKLPVLIQKGAADEAMKGTDELKAAFKTTDFTFNKYDGLYHEIYNELEKDREKVLKDLSSWLENHM